MISDTLYSEKRKISKYFTGFSLNWLKVSLLSVVRVKAGVGFRYFFPIGGFDTLFILPYFETGSNPTRKDLTWI